MHVQLIPVGSRGLPLVLPNTSDKNACRYPLFIGGEGGGEVDQYLTVCICTCPEMPARLS